MRKNEADGRRESQGECSVRKDAQGSLSQKLPHGYLRPYSPSLQLNNVKYEPFQAVPESVLTLFVFNCSDNFYLGIPAPFLSTTEDKPTLRERYHLCLGDSGIP